MNKVEKVAEQIKQQGPESVSFVRGYIDGTNSKGFKNPIHNNWKKAHCDPDYKRGYWAGYNS